jgi:hypothetical protein
MFKPERCKEIFFAQNLTQNTAWCNLWEISCNGNLYVNCNISQVALNLRMVKQVYNKMKKSGLLPEIHNHISSFIKDNEMILWLMQKAEMQQYKRNKPLHTS